MKTVLISGHFNVLHPGHLRLFKFARECGERLIVAVESDRIAGTAAYISEDLRLEGVYTNGFVDEAFIFDTKIEDVIDSYRPDIVVKGREHEDNFNVELEVLSTYGGELRFGAGDLVFSSSQLLKKEISSSTARKIDLPDAFLRRNQISLDTISCYIEQFKKLRIVVVGDVIVDEYISCQPLGMSQEEPTIVVTPIESQMFLGGSAIVAAHAASLGASVDLISVSGVDASGEFVSERLREHQVKPNILIDGTRPTTLKQRYMSKGKSLLRVSHLRQDAISKVLQKRLIETISQKMLGIDLLVFSDFNYGCLPQAVVDNLISRARAAGVLVAADSQTSSQLGDISRFKGVDLITPTEHEARVSMKNQEDGIVVLAEELRKAADAKHILLKLGEEGLLVQSRKSETGVVSDQVPALNPSPKDTSGAGDSLLISAAMAMAIGASIWEMGFIGSLAAAVQVSRLGNRPLTPQELVDGISG